MKDSIQKAINIVEKSRQSHIKWVKHFEKWPEDQALVKDKIHSLVEQKEIVAEYTEVLSVLKEASKTKQRAIDDVRDVFKENKLELKDVDDFEDVENFFDWLEGELISRIEKDSN